MKYTKKQNKKMLDYFISKIKENLEKLESCEGFGEVNSLIESNKGMLDSIEAIKNDGLGHFRFNPFRKEIDSMVNIEKA